MKILALDTETSTYNKGNPYDSRNKLVCYSFDCGEGGYAYTVDQLPLLRDFLAFNP